MKIARAPIEHRDLRRAEARRRRKDALYPREPMQSGLPPMPCGWKTGMPAMLVDCKILTDALDMLPVHGSKVLTQLLGHLWEHGHLPLSDDALAAVAGVKPRMFARMRVVLLKICFTIDADGRWREYAFEERRDAAFVEWARNGLGGPTLQ